jgi:hypothetical protein
MTSRQFVTAQASEQSSCTQKEGSTSHTHAGVGSSRANRSARVCIQHEIAGHGYIIRGQRLCFAAMLRFLMCVTHQLKPTKKTVVGALQTILTDFARNVDFTWILFHHYAIMHTYRVMAVGKACSPGHRNMTEIGSSSKHIEAEAQAYFSICSILGIAYNIGKLTIRRQLFHTFCQTFPKVLALLFFDRVI